MKEVQVHNTNSVTATATTPCPPPAREVLIVLEGCDRSGKTTLAQSLVADLNTSEAKAAPANAKASLASS